MAYQGTPSYSGAPAYQYADWLQRVGASLIDAAPIIVLQTIAEITGSYAFIYLVGLIGLGWQIYNRWYLGGQGQSYGKKVLGLMLVSEETGQPIGMLNAFLRDVCHFLDFIICFIGYLFPLWDPKRQTIADKIMRTVVIPVSQ
jgi:uncharacterized RDD family membrane protein YckC